MQIQDLTIQNEKLKSRVKLAEKMAEQHNRSERESKEALQVCDSFYFRVYCFLTNFQKMMTSQKETLTMENEMFSKQINNLLLQVLRI